MTEMRKQSSAADALMVKESDTNFVPMNYDYGKNFDGVQKGTRTPEMYEQKIHNRRKSADKYSEID